MRSCVSNVEIPPNSRTPLPKKNASSPQEGALLPRFQFSDLPPKTKSDGYPHYDPMQMHKLSFALSHPTSPTSPRGAATLACISLLPLHKLSST